MFGRRTHLQLFLIQETTTPPPMQDACCQRIAREWGSLEEGSMPGELAQEWNGAKTNQQTTMIQALEKMVSDL
jgi:hypothetical protein